jgi:hypothetical protein
VWRLGRQIDCVTVSAQYNLRPARKEGIELLIGGKRNHPRRLCSSHQRPVLHRVIRLISSWSMVPLWHSQWRTG